jgi:Holliday junction resolvasome RuvABC endonuclease subunit
VQYRPAEIKKAAAGKGNASKQAVALALVTRYGLDRKLAEGEAFDSTDALALALCHVPRVRAVR